MSNPIVPHVMKFILGHRLQQFKRQRIEKQRLKRNEPHRLTVYLSITDPYSFLLIQVLPQLAERYPVEYDFRTVLHRQSDMYPAPSLWDNNAFDDSRYLATLYGLSFPTKPPRGNPEREEKITAQLLHWELQPNYLENALPLFEAYWNSKTRKVNQLVSTTIATHTECYNHHRQANEQLLKDNGHYLSAMIHYGKEWYWGLGRLEHLEKRFNELGINKHLPPEVHFNATHARFCSTPKTTIKDKTPLEIFWSLRSPYSYIGLARAIKLSQHYGISLNIKPVLPMVMRRMQVPKTKGFYIIHDVKREADKYGINFGFMADPLGKGVERCYALYEFAQQQNKGIDFLESCARGVWAEGIRSDTDKGLKILVERAGLIWEEAQTLINKNDWRGWAQDNLLELYSKDLWGVPSFSYGEFSVFGQDRLERIEEAMLSAGIRD